MSQREYLGWQRYWEQEPWGPWRDNLHAAIIAREVRRPQMKRGQQPKIEDFFVVNPKTRAKSNKEKVFSMLEVMANSRKKRDGR